MSTAATPTAPKAGFTLPELLLGLVLSAIVAAGVFASFLLNKNGWLITTLTIRSSSVASTAIGRMVYGMGGPSLRTEVLQEMYTSGAMRQISDHQAAMLADMNWIKDADTGAGQRLTPEEIERIRREGLIIR